MFLLTYWAKPFATVEEQRKVRGENSPVFNNMYIICPEL